MVVTCAEKRNQTKCWFRSESFGPNSTGWLYSLFPTSFACFHVTATLNFIPIKAYNTVKLSYSNILKVWLSKVLCYVEAWGIFFSLYWHLKMVILLRKLCSDSTIFSCCFHVWSDLTKWEASNFYLPGVKTQTGLSASSLFLQQTFVNILTQWKTTQTQLNWEQFILKFNLSFDFFKETSIS